MNLELIANAAVRMLLVGLAAWLVLRLIRVRNPHVETLVWRMALLASLVLPALLYWRLAPDFTTSLQLPVIAGEEGAEASSRGASSSMLPSALAAIYLGVGLLLLARLAGGLAGMWRVSRAARPLATPDEVRLSEHIASPATFGGVILLPRDASTWPAEKLDAVLLHERMHVRGRDGYWSWLARLHAAVFWFSPFAWYLQRRLETLAETTSDDAVVAAHHDPVAYAALLLDFARHPNSRSVVMSVAESNIPKRIERLLARIPPASALPRAARWAALALMIPAVVLAASTTRAEPPAKAAAAAPASVDTATFTGVKMQSFPNPDNFYPAVAKAERVEGFAVVRVEVDPMGQVVDVVVLETQPADPRYGFADAAIQVAQRTRFSNGSNQSGAMKFKVKFALAE
jgi:TonB family protein